MILHALLFLVAPAVAGDAGRDPSRPEPARCTPQAALQPAGPAVGNPDEIACLEPAAQQRTMTPIDSPRCTVQQVHTPAGKLVHNAPIIRCGS